MNRLILKLASRDSQFRKSLIEKLGGKERKKHWAGDVWPVKEGFRAINVNGETKTFKNEKEAKEFAKTHGREKKGADKHKPGDVWKTPAGFRAMNPKGVAKSFKTQEEAKAWSKGSEEKGDSSIQEEGKKLMDDIESEIKSLRFNKPKRPSRESAERADQFLRKKERQLDQFIGKKGLSKSDPSVKEMRKHLDKLTNQILKDFDPNGEFLE